MKLVVRRRIKLVGKFPYIKIEKMAVWKGVVPQDEFEVLAANSLPPVGSHETNPFTLSHQPMREKSYD